jgi:hypothetical protein
MVGILELAFYVWVAAVHSRAKKLLPCTSVEAYRRRRGGLNAEVRSQLIRSVAVVYATREKAINCRRDVV